jgi:septum formation protein
MSLRLKKLMKYDLILASRSPRRQMLLQGLDLNFQVVVKNTKEEYPPEMECSKVPEFLSKAKAAAIDMDKYSGKTIVITADTIVILNGEIIEKPGSEEEAVAMLRKLSGNTHTVITGVCLTSKTKQRCFSAESKVKFRTLDEDDIQYYVYRYQPFDKAGSYGIQEWIGYIAIESIEGSFYNVMGLPTQKLYEELIDFVS